MCFDSPDTGADEVRERERKRQENIKKGQQSIDTTFSQFDEPFFDERRQAFIDYQQPRVEDQYNNALRQLTFALARSGLNNSSVGSTRRANAREKYDFAQQDMRQRADASANDARTAIENARQELSANNAALADPTAAANAAISRAESLNALPKYEPMLDLFGSLSEGLATQADLERRKQNRYPALFGTGSSASIKG